MNSNLMIEKAGQYLRRLCLEIPSRRVGSQGNQAATDFFERTIASFTFRTKSPSFDCIDWTSEGADLITDDSQFEASASPYSLGCKFGAPLVVASTLEQLEAAEADGKILLLQGDLTKEQLMPKNFPFYNPDHHKKIIHLLEAKRPAAIVAATSRDVEVAGAVYPFPLIEDGDFDIPSVYMTEEEGQRLAQYAGKQVALESRARRIPSTGCNVIAQKGTDPDRRAVLFAHIDAKSGTPGALDNASGIVVLLLLAELLADYSGELGIEIVALNGEDYYSGVGEQEYLRMNSGRFKEIVLGINLDGAGYHRGKTAYSLYDCPPEIVASIRKVFSANEELVEGEPWYQGDHGLFLMNERPALAITSERFIEILSEIAHTARDRPEIVDTVKLVRIALGFRDLLVVLDEPKGQ
jgi:aminopeptidase YwaD